MLTRFYLFILTSFLWSIPAQGLEMDITIDFNDELSTEIQPKDSSFNCTIEVILIDNGIFDTQRGANNFCNNFFNQHRFDRRHCIVRGHHGGRFQGSFHFNGRFNGNGRDFFDARRGAYQGFINWFEQHRIFLRHGGQGFNVRFGNRCG